MDVYFKFDSFLIFFFISKLIIKLHVCSINIWDMIIGENGSQVINK